MRGGWEEGKLKRARGVVGGTKARGGRWAAVSSLQHSRSRIFLSMVRVSKGAGHRSPGAQKFLPWSPEPEAFYYLEPVQE